MSAPPGPADPPAPGPAEAEIDESIGRVMAGVRPGLDRFVRDVMRAQVAAALFQRAPKAVRLGRYELRREVGAGGGGSVFVAWDPELEREVAVKLVTAPDPALRARALAEGQALAKLSHPNVIPVFDVGAVEDRVYLVMELIRGQSLRTYAAGRRPREILAAYRQCCDGLAAAHDAKLVHRDFKPDNALMGADGRVRVIDFGLAIEDHAQQGMRGGTPRYMAPEQRQGETITAATDQYAFAISLREALGQVPAWLVRVLARAEAERPEQRFASMRDLAAALARDPRTVWRRRALVVTPVALAVAGFWLGRERAPVEEPCRAPAALLGDAWSDARRAEVGHRLAALGHPYAQSVAPRLVRRFDDHAARWQASHQQACLAYRRGDVSAAAYDRQQACLSGARTQLAALSELAARVELPALPQLVSAAPELADPAGCAEAAALDGAAPPSREQEQMVAALAERASRLRVRVEARVPEAQRELDSLVKDARATGYRPALARALLLAGTYALKTGAYDDAVAPLAEALELAFAARLYDVGVEAFARHAWLRARSAKREEVFGGVAPMVALASGLPASGRFAEALLHNNLGSMHVIYDEPTLARGELTRAIALAAHVEGPGSIELANAKGNLALVTEDEPARRALFTQQLAYLRESLGEDHPAALGAAIIAEVESGEPAASREALRGLCARLSDLHPTLRRRIGDCWIDLGWLELGLGDEAAAAVAFARGNEVLGDTTWAHVSGAYLAAMRGELAVASAALKALPARAWRAEGRWHDLLYAGSAELARARAELVRGSAVARRAALERAVADLTAAAAKHPSRVVARRLAWAKEQLAARAK